MGKKNNKKKNNTYQDLILITDRNKLIVELRTCIRVLPSIELIQLMLNAVKHCNKLMLSAFQDAGINLDVVLLSIVQADEKNMQPINLILDLTKNAVFTNEFLRVLGYAGRSGNIELLESLFASRNVPVDHFHNVIISATQLGHAQVLRHFWKKMANDKKVLRDLLGISIQVGNFSLINAFLEQGMQLSELREGRYSAFYYAALSNEYEMLSYFKSDATQQDIYYALSASVDLRHLNSLNYILLIPGINANHISEGMTPLLRAIRRQDGAMISRLISAGASLASVDGTPAPLDYAISQNSARLFENLPNSDLVSRNAKHLWRHAIESCAHNVLEVLMKHSPLELHQPIDLGLNLPLHRSILLKSRECMAALIELGADPFLLNGQGLSAMDLVYLSGEAGLYDCIFPCAILQRHRQKFGIIPHIEALTHKQNFYLVEALLALSPKLETELIDKYLPFLIKKDEVLSDTVDFDLIVHATSFLAKQALPLDLHLDKQGRALLPKMLAYLEVAWPLLNVDREDEKSPEEILQILHALAGHCNAGNLEGEYQEATKRKQEIIITVSKSNVNGHYLNKTLSCLWSRYMKMLLPLFAKINARVVFHKRSRDELNDLLDACNKVINFIEFNKVMYELYAFNKDIPPFSVCRENLIKITATIEGDLRRQVKKEAQAADSELRTAYRNQKIAAQKAMQEAELHRLQSQYELYEREGQARLIEEARQNEIAEAVKERAAGIEEVNKKRLADQKALETMARQWGKKHQEVLLTVKNREVGLEIASSSQPVIVEITPPVFAESEKVAFFERIFPVSVDIEMVFNCLKSLEGELYAVGSSVMRMIREAAQVSTIETSDVDVVGFDVDVEELLKLGFYRSLAMPHLYKNTINGLKVEIYLNDDISPNRLITTMQARDFTVCSLLCSRAGRVMALKESYFSDVVNNRLTTLINPIECFRSDPVRLVRAMGFVLKGLVMDEDVAEAIKAWTPVMLSHAENMHINLKIYPLLINPAKNMLLIKLLMANGLLEKLFNVVDSDLVRSLNALTLRVGACVAREYKPSAAGFFASSSQPSSPITDRRIYLGGSV